MQHLRKISNHIFIILGFSLGATTVMVPLQHYITLGRYQHYGMGLFLFGLGYAMQFIWTWRKQTFWSRLCYACTGAFFCTVGLLFYMNPWLDWKTSAQTEDKWMLRTIFMGFYLLLGFFLLLLWLITY